MSVVVKEEPAWEVSSESEQDGLQHLKIVKVEMLTEPECNLHEEEPQYDKQDPLHMNRTTRDGERRGSTEGLEAGLNHEVPTPSGSKTVRQILKEAVSKMRTQRAKLKKQKLKQFHSCKVCKREFTRTSAYKAHIKTHKRKKPYCKICKREFGRQSALNTHNKRWHTDFKAYTCEICSKAFTEAHLLKRHFIVHTGQKPFRCSICGRAFSNPNHLKDHYQVHSENKPFTCDLCNGQFKRKYSLKCHMILHTGEKPFSCNICDKRFIRSTDLKEHAGSHSEEKPYACDKCNAEFSRKDSYFRHVKRLRCRGSGRPVKDRN